MTIKDLKKAIENYPDNMEVMLSGGKTEFTYGSLNSVRQQQVRFSEDEDSVGEPESFEECVILDEE